MSNSPAEQILEEARKRFDAAEVFEESGETLSVDFEDNRLKEITTKQHRGVGLRVIHKGRIGFAATTDLRDPGRLVEMAAASAQFGDEARFELPAAPAKVDTVEGYDKSVLDVTAQQMVDMGRAGLEMSIAAHPDYLYGCGVSRSTHRQRVLNTAGLDFESSTTGMGASVGVQLVSDDGMLQVYEYKSWRQPLDSVEDLARTVLDKMVQARTIVPAGLEVMPMIFVPKSLGNLLGPLTIALNGKHVQKGSSVLRDKLGEQVLDERITITDDPTVPFAPGSCALDDEGIPTRRRHLFDRGMVGCFTTDLQTAGLLGIEPSGHGFRSYASRPAPGGTNRIVATGDTTLADMIGSLERGLIVEQTLGSGQSNVLAGDFSVNVELGFLVERGKVRGRVKDCMVAGNVYELLKDNVEAIGSELQWLGSGCAPPLMIGGMKLAARG